MSARATNLAILALLLLELGSGLGSLLVGSPGGRWVFWLHGAGGLSLVVLAAWKWRIIVRSLSRRRAGAWAVAPVLLGTIVVATLATGLWWAAAGRGSVPVPVYGPMRPLVLHALLALVLIPPFVAHVAVRWPRPGVADRPGRRAALRLLGVGAGGLLLSRGLVATSVLVGPERRFTGSREEASFSGNAHPVTNWLTDRRQRIEASGWRLSVRGDVDRPAEIGHAELSAMPMREQRAILDCTGGWYTRQDWAGIPLEAVIAQAGPAPGARSVVIRSATGYYRRFALGEAGPLLLATHVGGEPLSAGHGFPVRLVAPGRRGYHWVKWVEVVEINSLPAWWQPPLPTQ